MRTTLDLNDVLLREAKKRAAEGGRSLTSYIEDALRLALANVSKRGGKIRLRVSRHGLGLKPGISLDDISAVNELLDEEDGPR